MVGEPINESMARGGPRPNSGRPTKAEENKTASIAKAAIAGKFGSIKKGFQFLLESGEPSLIKFVFEHGYGKPQEKVALTLPEGVKSFKIVGAGSKN